LALGELLPSLAVRDFLAPQAASETDNITIIKHLNDLDIF